MLKTPFYDPSKTYDENYDKGPFGAFAEGPERSRTSIPLSTTLSVNRMGRRTDGKPQHDFLGQKVYTPFGIPAGPLINSNFCKGAFEKGFDICVYKTVRSGVYPCHPFPNVLAVKVEGDLTIKRAQDKLIADNNYSEPLNITNSFGVPSKAPEVWQEDCKKAISYARGGQVLVLSFMGTVKENQTSDEFVTDYAMTAKLAYQTSAKILETNLSCPNIGNEGLVCYNLEMTEKVCKAIRNEIGNTPLILKVGYYKNNDDIKKLLEIASKYAQAVSSINTIQAEIIDKDGNQALPGKMRARSGVCGAAIKWAGLEMVKKLVKIKKSLGIETKIIGVGGVTNASDYFDYLQAGADCVMSATGAMWNPNLAQEIKQKI